MPTRRELLWGAAGAAGALAAGGVVRALAGAARDAGAPSGSPLGAGRAPAGMRGIPLPGHGAYGHGVEPPDGMGPDALDAVTIPPPPVRGPVARTLTITERPVAVAAGVDVRASTFDGTLPGPILRVTEGERLTLTVRNLTAVPHNLHTHGSHSPSQDGWEPIPAGGSRTYALEPRPFGVYPYHCDLVPGAQHLAAGLYGLLIVDPPDWRSPAQERVLLLGGFDADGDGTPELFGWNGVAGFHARHPLRVRAGAPVRLYVATFVADPPVTTFHLHARTFDVFRDGTRRAPDAHTDAVALTLGERAILETTFPEPGRHMFHPHQPAMAEHGAMGWIAVLP